VIALQHGDHVALLDLLSLHFCSAQRRHAAIRGATVRRSAATMSWRHGNMRSDPVGPAERSARARADLGSQHREAKMRHRDDYRVHGQGKHERAAEPGSSSVGKRTLTTETAPDPATPAHAGRPDAPPLEQHARTPSVMRRMDAGVRPDIFASQHLRAAAGTSAADVQRKDDGAPGHDVHQLAAQGISGTSASLPFRDQIQRSFGAHDVSGIQSHLAGPATAACEGMGAQAYATGNHVAFRQAPDLHTVAHEAAHVVQQRAGAQLAGGVGQAGDAYERNADQIADAVVAGRSAEALLGGGGQPDRIAQAPLTCPTCGAGACECATASNAGAAAVQREEFEGAAGKTASNKKRPIIEHPGELPQSDTPGGKIIPNTGTSDQNCAGDSVGQNKYINWPKLGHQAEDKVVRDRIDADWEAAQAFVPTGCTRVSNDGISVNNTRCKSGELELIVFLYRWPVGYLELPQSQDKILVYQSDFHMVGRFADTLPSGWHSKMDRRERVEDIRDPLQSLHDAYPHTRKKDRTIVRLTFCGTQSAIKTK
jgi:hypothetical protein